MIKARYIGVECELQSGKVYPIKTRCTGNKLVVSVRAYKFEYNSLEELGIELYVNTLPQIEDHSVSGFLMVKRVGEPVKFL